MVDPHTADAIDGARALELPARVRAIAASDCAVLLEVADVRSREALDHVHALFFALSAARPPWIVELRPAYTSLLVEIDPLRARLDDVTACVDALLAAPADASTHGTRTVRPLRAARTHHIAVRYGAGPVSDLDEVAASCGMTTREVIARHVASRLTVAFLGFMPGFAYLDGLDATLRAPRRPAPRPRVVRGSVAIAAGQAAIYPDDGPGGWQILGVTDVDVRGLGLALGDTIVFSEAS